MAAGCKEYVLSNPLPGVSKDNDAVPNKEKLI